MQKIFDRLRNPGTAGAVISILIGLCATPVSATPTEDCGSSLITYGHGEDFPLLHKFLEVLPDLAKWGAVKGILSGVSEKDAKPWSERDPEYAAAASAINDGWASAERDLDVKAVEADYPKMLVALCASFSPLGQTQLVTFASDPHIPRVRRAFDAYLVGYAVMGAAKYPVDKDKLNAVKVQAAAALKQYAKDPDWNQFLLTQGKSLGVDQMWKDGSGPIMAANAGNIIKAGIGDSMGTVVQVMQQMFPSIEQARQRHAAYLARVGTADQASQAAPAADQSTGPIVPGSIVSPR